MAKSIEISDLDIYYGDFLAVEGVSMTIPARSVTALIGPSGCGKSTFLRSLNRMHEVIPGARVDGKVVIDGQELYAPEVDPVEVRRQIGMVFQRPNPFPTMSIRDNVSAGLRLNGTRKRSDLDAVVERALQGAGLWKEVRDRLDGVRLAVQWVLDAVGWLGSLPAKAELASVSPVFAKAPGPNDKPIALTLEVPYVYREDEGSSGTDDGRTTRVGVSIPGVPLRVYE